MWKGFRVLLTTPRYQINFKSGFKPLKYNKQNQKLIYKLFFIKLKKMYNVTNVAINIIS